MENQTDSSFCKHRKRISVNSLRVMCQAYFRASGFVQIKGAEWRMKLQTHET